MSMDVRVPYNVLIEAGDWLDTEMPNPPLPESQRWTIGYSEDGRSGICFESEQDAMWFTLKWL